MTSVEHVQSLLRSSDGEAVGRSASGGDGALEWQEHGEGRDEVGIKAREVAVTRVEEDEQGGQVRQNDVEAAQQDGSDEQDEDVAIGIAVGGEEDEEEGEDGAGEGYSDVGSLEVVGASRSRSRLTTSSVVSRVASGSRSGLGTHSRSLSGSPTRSSVREMGMGMGMGEESSATSWTQGDGERPSGDSEQRPSGEDYRLGVDLAKVRVRLRPGPDLEEEIGEEGSREGMDGVGLSRLRTGMNADRREDASRKEVLVMQEADIGEDWHPLRYNGKERSHDDETEVETGDLGSVHGLESLRSGDRTLEMNEKERWRTFGSSGRNSRHLRLDFKAPSPQPWDDIDPPADTNEVYTSDYYSTLNSKKFATLQKSRRRPLIPHSTYYFGPPPPDSAYGTPPVGQIGIHHPREIVRIERDYAGGELVQFSPVFPLELEGRITPTQFHQAINDINEILISAHSIQHACLDNFLSILTLQLSTLIITSHYAKEMRRLKQKIDELNTQLYNPVGLHILWPQKVAFLFLEIEYYASLF